MYKEFSYIYDKLSFDIDYEKYANNIKSLISDYKINKDRMLELACGSGMLTRHFFDDFKSIDALDISSDMLSCFKNKHDNINLNLINYNMVDFKNESTYDLIIILLDSINYVTDPNDLRKLFENSYKNLKEDSLLVFDINSEYKMRQVLGSNCYVYEYEDIFYSRDNFLERDQVDMYLNFFVKNEDGLYKRIKEFQQERIYKLEYIKKLIEEIGFKDIRIFDEDSMEAVNEKTLRVLFSARKAGK